MSLCGDFDPDRIAGRPMPVASPEDEARVDFVMANMVRDGIYFTYEGPGKADLTDNQLLILGARLEKLRQEEHAASLTRPVDAGELARRLEARSPSPTPSWTSEDEQRLTEIARGKLEQYGYPMPSSEELENPSDRLRFMEQYFKLEEELLGRGGSLLRHLEHDWVRFRHYQLLDRRLIAEIIASDDPSRDRRYTLINAPERYCEWRKDNGYSDVEMTLCPDVAAQSRLMDWCEYQFWHLGEQNALKIELARFNKKIERSKAGEGWPWQATAIFRDSTLAVFESHEAVLEWIEERRQEMAGEKPRRSDCHYGTGPRRALPGEKKATLDPSVILAEASRPGGNITEDCVAIMRSIGLFGPTHESTTQDGLTRSGTTQRYQAWPNFGQSVPRPPTIAIETIVAPKVAWGNCGVRGCIREGCKSIKPRRSERVANMALKKVDKSSKIQKPAQKAGLIRGASSGRNAKPTREEKSVVHARSVNIVDSIEIPAPVEMLAPTKNRLENSRKTTKVARAKRPTSKAASSESKASKVAQAPERKIAGRKGPKVEPSNVIATTRRGRDVKKPVRYGLDQ